VDSAEPGVTGDNHGHDVHRRSGPIKRLTKGATRVRAWVRRRPGGATAWRVVIAVSGLIIIAVGLVLLVLPGPGWVTIFLGLGLWATEFKRARALLNFARRQVQTWTRWIGRQPRWLSIGIGGAGLILVAVVVWTTST
jgi:uncharacterized protein (TIGR02611 family)